MTAHDVVVIVIATVGGGILGAMLQIAVIRIALWPIQDDLGRLVDHFVPMTDDD